MPSMRKASKFAAESGQTSRSDCIALRLSRGGTLRFILKRYNCNFYVPKRVRYQESYPEANLVKMTPDELVNAILLTKAQFWEYEKEWRIMEHDKGPGLYCFPEKFLTGVILGCQMPEEQKRKIREWVELRKVSTKIYEARKKAKEFGLDLQMTN